MYFIKENYKIVFLAFDFLAMTISHVLFLNIFNISGVVFYNYSLLTFIFFLTIVFTEEYSNIRERGFLLELKSSLSFVIKILFVFVAFTSLIDTDDIIYKFNYKSASIFFTIFLVILYIVRIILKKIYISELDERTDILLLSSIRTLDEFESSLPDKCNVKAYVIKDYTGKIYKNKVVLKDENDIRDFLSKNSVNEIYSDYMGENISDILFYFKKVGIPTKLCVDSIFDNTNNESTIVTEKNKKYVVLAVKIATLRQMFLKRLVDIVASIFGLIITFFVALIILPIVRKQSPGPIFFSQTRIGKNGKKFKMYKFRSMHINAEQELNNIISKNEYKNDLMFKAKDDPRIFPFGKKLREWSLDEFPQFLNVLKGDMSLVGTRPPTVYEYEKYDLHHFKRLLIKPGITGLWQISGRSDITDFEEVVKLDVEYIENWSLRFDIKILFKTVVTVLKKQGSR